MNICNCYCEEEYAAGWFGPDKPALVKRSVCNGTRERDICSCGGDRTKCDFYPEVREKAKKEQEPRFGEWISVNDRLPEELFAAVLIYCTDRSNIYCAYLNARNEWHIFDYGAGQQVVERVTHWMPLPSSPKGE